MPNIRRNQHDSKIFDIYEINILFYNNGIKSSAEHRSDEGRLSVVCSHFYFCFGKMRKRK